jgi:hypothetical protein
MVEVHSKEAYHVRKKMEESHPIKKLIVWLENGVYWSVVKIGVAVIPFLQMLKEGLRVASVLVALPLYLQRSFPVQAPEAQDMVNLLPIQ